MTQTDGFSPDYFDQAPPMTTTAPTTHRVRVRKRPARTAALGEAWCTCGWTGHLLPRDEARAEADAHRGGS